MQTKWIGVWKCLSNVYAYLYILVALNFTSRLFFVIDDDGKDFFFCQWTNCDDVGSHTFHWNNPISYNSIVNSYIDFNILFAWNAHSNSWIYWPSSMISVYGVEQSLQCSCHHSPFYSFIIIIILWSCQCVRYTRTIMEAKCSFCYFCTLFTKAIALQSTTHSYNTIVTISLK